MTHLENHCGILGLALFGFCVVLGMKPRAAGPLSICSPTELQTQPWTVLDNSVIFQKLAQRETFTYIQSKLFMWKVLEMQRIKSHH
jgi:hypothetical protein